MKTTPDSYIERNDMSDEPGPIDPDDACIVCNKMECECPPEEDFRVETPPAIDQTPNETGQLKCPVGNGWRLLGQGEPLEKGDGFLHPDYDFWIAFECRPDLFRGDREFAHTWPWRRKIIPEDHNDSSDSRQQKEELGASDEHVKRMITFGEMWHRKKLTPKELADAIQKAKQDHPQDFPQ